MDRVTTTAHVRKVLREIRQRAKCDIESAASLEGDLHEGVLEAIADGTAESPRDMARAALKSKKIAWRYRA